MAGPCAPCYRRPGSPSITRLGHLNDQSYIKVVLGSHEAIVVLQHSGLVLFWGYVTFFASLALLLGPKGEQAIEYAEWFMVVWIFAARLFLPSSSVASRPGSRS